MKQAIFINFLVLIFLSTSIYSSLPGTSSKTNSQWLVSGKVASEHVPLLNSVTSTPVVGIIKNCDGTHTAQQYIKDRTTSSAIPPSVIPILQNGQFSVLRGNDTDFTTCPKGNELFQDYQDLASKFDNMISIMINQKNFKSFFNKVHLNCLNELYEYLMNIYTNFNLQHVGIKESQAKGSTSLTFNIPLFLQNEQDTDQNTKTLIINHLINIIESQINGKIRSIMPTIPHIFATVAGKALIENDYSIDLKHFIDKQVDAGMIQYQQTYLKGMAAYLSFFQAFTSYLNKPHPHKSEHFTAFVHIAETINMFIYGSSIGDQPDTTSESSTENANKKMQQLLSKMNPPLFTFNYDDIRALKLIPKLAKSIPPTSKTIGWPTHIIKCAQNGTMINNRPIAYFKDKNKKTTTSLEQAKDLYIVIQSGSNFFQECLKEQPEWLNSWQGVCKIMAACFGDFSQLIGLDILDPCMEALIQNAVNTIQGTDAIETNQKLTEFQSLLKNVKNLNYCKPPKTKQTDDSLTNQDAAINSLSDESSVKNSDDDEMGSPSIDNVPSSNDIDNLTTNSIDSDNNETNDDEMGAPSDANISNSIN